MIDETSIFKDSTLVKISLTVDETKPKGTCQGGLIQNTIFYKRFLYLFVNTNPLW